MTEFFNLILDLINSAYIEIRDFIPLLLAVMIALHGFGKGWLMDIQLPYLRHANRWLIGLGNLLERFFGKKPKTNKRITYEP